MKNKKNIVMTWCALFVLMAGSLSACAPKPTHDGVISKNDGSFDISVLQTEPSKSEYTMEATRCIQYTELFTSTDGSVEFSFNIDQNITDQAYPVVEVRPHMFTSNDVRTIASVLFG